jgi:V/A-type H+-transporting ATPase subunit A
VPIDYHVTLWKSELLDFVILQQDAFDKIDASTSLERQEYMLKKIVSITGSNFKFDNFEEVGIYFKRLINVFRQLNYTVFKSEEFNNTEREADAILEERIIK